MMKKDPILLPGMVSGISKNAVRFAQVHGGTAAGATVNAAGRQLVTQVAGGEAAAGCGVHRAARCSASIRSQHW